MINQTTTLLKKIQYLQDRQLDFEGDNYRAESNHIEYLLDDLKVKLLDIEIKDKFKRIENEEKD